jgi:hypothetical protein
VAGTSSTVPYRTWSGACLRRALWSSRRPSWSSALTHSVAESLSALAVQCAIESRKVNRSHTRARAPCKHTLTSTHRNLHTHARSHRSAHEHACTHAYTRARTRVRTQGMRLCDAHGAGHVACCAGGRQQARQLCSAPAAGRSGRPPTSSRTSPADVCAGREAMPRLPACRSWTRTVARRIRLRAASDCAQDRSDA